MIILYNPENENQIYEFENENQIGGGFSNWKKLEGIKLNNYKLQQAKTQKHCELYNDYINANLKEKNHEALVIQGKGAGTVRQFKFKQKYDNAIPALDSDRFLNICINSNKALPYETEAVEGDKIVVQIKPLKAKEILDHMILRYGQNYAIHSFLKNKIDNCKTIQEVENVKWDMSVITPEQLSQVQQLLNS